MNFKWIAFLMPRMNARTVNKNASQNAHIINSTISCNSSSHLRASLYLGVHPFGIMTPLPEDECIETCNERSRRCFA